THDEPPGATLADPSLEGATTSLSRFVSRKRARRWETASAARSVQESIRRAVWRAPSTLGGSADNIRRQVLAFMTMPHRHSLSSFEIASIRRPSAVNLRKGADPESPSDRIDEFRAELIHIPRFSRAVG